MKRFMLILGCACGLTLLLFSVAMADDEVTGPALFEDYGCSDCHALNVGTAPVPGAVVAAEESDDDDWGDDWGEGDGGSDGEAPDLGTIGALRDSTWVSLWLQKKNDIEGRKHMYDFDGDDAERAVLSDWLASLKPLEESTEGTDSAEEQ